MKLFIKIILGVLLVIIVVVAYAGWTYRQLSKETYVFVNETMIAVSTAWNSDELKKRSHTLLLQEMDKQGESWEKYFSVYRKLGALKSSDCKLVNYKTFSGTSGSYTNANYSCSSMHDNGEATVNIAIRKDSTSNLWQVAMFRVDAPLFMKILQQ